MPFPFLDLPPEIRERIFYLFCHSPAPVHLSSLRHFHHHVTFPHSLLLTNTQIYHEIRSVYFTANIFAITIRRQNNILTDTYLGPSFHDNLLLIRSLRLTILRWGSGSFFLQTLIPALEDLILNGRLRVLEVVVRAQFLKGLQERGWDGVRGEFENWRAIRTVLGDEYLEEGRLLATRPQMGVGSGFVEESVRDELDDVTNLLWNRGREEVVEGVMLLSS